MASPAAAADLALEANVADARALATAADAPGALASPPAAAPAQHGPLAAASPAAVAAQAQEGPSAAAAAVTEALASASAASVAAASLACDAEVEEALNSADSGADTEPEPETEEDGQPLLLANLGLAPAGARGLAAPASRAPDLASFSWTEYEARFHDQEPGQEGKFSCPFLARGCKSAGLSSLRDLARHVVGRGGRPGCHRKWGVAAPEADLATRLNKASSKSVAVAGRGQEKDDPPSPSPAKRAKRKSLAGLVPPVPLDLTVDPGAVIRAPQQDAGQQVWELVQILQQRGQGDEREFLVVWRNTVELVPPAKPGQVIGHTWTDGDSGKRVAEVSWPRQWVPLADAVNMAEAIEEFEAKVANM